MHARAHHTCRLRESERERRRGRGGEGEGAAALKTEGVKWTYI